MKFIGYDNEGFAMYKVVDKTGILSESTELTQERQENFDDFKI